MKEQIKNMVKPDRGDKAPDFQLPSTTGDLLSLSDLKGKPVILAFYPSDWSPTCGEQMVLYNEVLPIFEDYGAELLGISVDGLWSHKAYAAERNLQFPLLSDFEPKGSVSRLYGVYNESKGVSERALFVINRDGTIHWKHVSPSNVNPGADGILRALEELG